jgi:tetratricopeptide (TPR) repeat protein
VQKRQQAAELPRCRAQLRAERQHWEAEELARRKSQEARDQAAYTRLIEDGKRLLTHQQYDIAVATLQTARHLRKTDEVEHLLSQAQAKKEAARGKADATARIAQIQKREQDRQRAAEVEKHLTRARTALAARNLNGAARAIASAAQLAPKDPAVLQAQQDLEQARKAVAAEADKAKRLAAYQEALRSGRASLAARRYDAAVKAFTEAQRLSPHDPSAMALLQQAVKARDDARAAAAAELKKQQEQERRRGDFTRWMAQGQTAMAGKRFAEAVKAYGEALKVQPGHVGATTALREAQQALVAFRTPSPRPTPSPPPVPKPVVVNIQAEFSRQMQAGAAFDNQQKFAEAVGAYKMALQLVPGDARAAAALKVAQFSLHMAEGQKARAARRFADAVREFDAALQLFPNHPGATAALKQARQGR